MKKAEIITKMEGQSDTSEFILRSTEEENTFLENYSKGKVDTAISELHSKYDQDIFDLVGLRKEATEKTYDFNKRIVKSLLDKSKDFEVQITTLKEKIKNNTGDEHLKTELASVQKLFKDFKEQAESEKANIETKYQKTLNRADIEKYIPEFKLKPMDEDVKKVFLDKIIDELSSMAQRQDEVLVFVDKEGKILRNKNNSLNPYSAKELLAEKLKNIIEGERKVEGVDFDKAVEKDKDGKFKVNIVRPDSIKTKVQVSEWLVKDGGFKRNTPEYQAAYAELAKDLPFK